MIQLRCWVLAMLFSLAGLGIFPQVVRAEGNVFFGGYGYDHPNCGSGALPCGTYNYARRQACNLSENEQDTYHIFHVYDGYLSSCDMVGGSGREQQGWIERDWLGLLQSILLPALVIFAFTWMIVWLYHRRRQQQAPGPFVE
jgi:hypothetical protein